MPLVCVPSPYTPRTSPYTPTTGIYTPATTPYSPAELCPILLTEARDPINTEDGANIRL